MIIIILISTLPITGMLVVMKSTLAAHNYLNSCSFTSALGFFTASKNQSAGWNIKIELHISSERLKCIRVKS